MLGQERRSLGTEKLVHSRIQIAAGAGVLKSMKIERIVSAGLRGSTPEGGWANEIKPGDCIHTLVAVYTNEGITGWGSAFTNDTLVQGSLRVLEPLFLGENPLEPERVSEKLRANTFWMGRGGSITHTISAIDIASVDQCAGISRLQNRLGSIRAARFCHR